MIEMFGKKGHFCITIEEIQQALKESFAVSRTKKFQPYIIILF